MPNSPPDTTLQKLCCGVKRMQRNRSTHSRSLLSTCVYVPLGFAQCTAKASVCAHFALFTCESSSLTQWPLSSRPQSIISTFVCFAQSWLGAKNKLAGRFVTQNAFRRVDVVKTTCWSSNWASEKGKKRDLRDVEGDVVVVGGHGLLSLTRVLKKNDQWLLVCLFTGIQTSLAANVKVQCKVANLVGHKVTTHWTASPPAPAPPLGEGHGSVFGPQGIPVGANSSKTTRTQCEVMKNSERLLPDEPKDFSCKACVSFLTLAHKEISLYRDKPVVIILGFLLYNFRIEHSFGAAQSKGQPVCRFLLICKIVGSDCWKTRLVAQRASWRTGPVLSGELWEASLWGRIARQIKWSNNVPESQFIYLFMFHAFASLAVPLERERVSDLCSGWSPVIKIVHQAFIRVAVVRRKSFALSSM